MVLAHRLLDTGEALERGVALALDGAPSREVASEVYRLGLNPEAVATFAIRGIAAYINDRLSVVGDSWAGDEARGESEKGHAPRPMGRAAAVRPHYARDLWERVLTVKTWEVADGQRKALLHFTVTDAELVMHDARAKAAGHAKVADAMELAARLLAKHKAATVSALPVKAKVAIAEAVA